MLNLVPITETRAGRDLIAIGHEKGRKEGRKEALRTSIDKILNFRFGEADSEQMRQIMWKVYWIPDDEALEILFDSAMRADSLAAFLTCIDDVQN